MLNVVVIGVEYVCKKMRQTKYFLLLLLFTFIVKNSFAARIVGVVVDAKSAEALVGASVFLKNTSFGSSVGLDGSYELKSIPVGSYTLIVQLVGYGSSERAISISSENEVVRNNFFIAEKSSELAEIVVTAEGEKESEASTRRLEQKADNVVNIAPMKSATPIATMIGA